MTAKMAVIEICGFFGEVLVSITNSAKTVPNNRNISLQLHDNSFKTALKRRSFRNLDPLHVHTKRILFLLRSSFNRYLSKNLKSIEDRFMKLYANIPQSKS